MAETEPDPSDSPVNISNISILDANETSVLLINQEPKPQRTFFEVFFVVMPLFCGYACLFALQREVKKKYGIADDNSANSHIYGAAASLVYIGNFIFRLGHNFIFFFCYPRTRVIIAIASMMTSMIILTIVMLFMKEPSLVWVFFAYALGGLGIGTFESNLLSTITPLGKNTKFWAIVAMPTGILSITVGGFILLEVGVNAGFIYLGTAIFCVVGLGLFMVRIFRLAGTGNFLTFRQFIHHIMHWRHWVPQIRWHALALMVDMFFVSMFSPGVILYIFDQKTIQFRWIPAKPFPTEWFFVIYDAIFFLGDTISRRIFYQTKLVFPLIFWIFLLLGAVAGLSNTAELVPLCAFFVAFANGSIYSQANRKIDQSVDTTYSLVAFSFWLFLGDVGSVLGSNLISFVSVAVHRIYQT